MYRIIAGSLFLLCLSAGCTLIEEPVVARNIGDFGKYELAAHPDKNRIEVGLEVSPLKVGSVFVYDSPAEQWEVTGSDGYNLFWRESRGQTKVTTLSTILPDLRWNGGNRSGRRMLTEVHGFLHPMKIGNRISFHEETLHASPPGAFSGDWRCEVQARAELTVPAGTFDTWQVLCKVNGLEYLLANYSEKLGVNVRMIYVTDDNQVSVRRLVTSSLLQSEDKATGEKTGK